MPLLPLCPGKDAAPAREGRLRRMRERCAHAPPKNKKIYAKFISMSQFCDILQYNIHCRLIVEAYMNDPKGILDEVKKAVVGKDGVLVMALLAILAGGHILLEDIPGVGKTTMALAFSKA